MATNDDVTESLQARIADPLWMLARQWQFNEFQGEDAGSPIGAALKVTGLPVATLLHPTGAVPEVALPAPFAPVEAMVEHEQVLPVHPKLNAQAGQQLMRMLRAAGLDATIAELVDHYPAPLAAPDDAVADNAGFVWNALLDQRAVDALALAGDVKALGGSRPALEAFSATVGVGAAQTQGVVRSRRALAASGSPTSPSTAARPARARTGSRSASSTPSRSARRASARRCACSPTSTPTAASTGTPTRSAPRRTGRPGRRRASTIAPERPPLPTTAHYPGMPADRYWEFEDGRVNFGMTGAAKSDLARLAVLEYALVFGNDWFVLPLTLPTNALYRVSTFTVRDNFGIDLPIPPAGWNLYEMSLGRARRWRASTTRSTSARRSTRSKGRRSST